jgi:hypothetical protein
VEPFGDRDYNLYNFSVCDDCRYGVASLDVQGTVLFDLGMSPEIYFLDTRAHPAAQNKGAFTFKHDEQQYLLINGLPGGCSGTATLYKFDGILLENLTQVDCLTDHIGSGFVVNGGFYLSNESGTFLYIVSGSSSVSIFWVDDSGPTLELIYLGTPTHAGMVRGKGIRVDQANGLAATASNYGTKLWDISTLDQPVELASWSPHPTTSMNVAAIRYPYLWVAKTGENKPFTFETMDPTHPRSMSQDFWLIDAAHEWNTYPYSFDVDAVFSNDGTALYVGRYSVLEVVSTTDCVPVPPTAAFSLSPAVPCPGDVLTVTNTSSGVWDRSAIWVRNGVGALVAGSTALHATTPISIQLTIPIDLSSSETFTAYVAVDSWGFPYNSGSPGVQLEARVISINRTPSAVILPGS